MAKKAAPKTTPDHTAKEGPAVLEMDVKIHSINTGGNVLANASVTLGGCFAVRGLRIVNSAKGPFVSMPGYKTQNGLKDVCFPCTKEFHQRFQETVLHAYHQELAQLQSPQRHERQREKPAFEERAAPGPAETREEAPPAGPEEAPEEDGPALGGMAMQ